MTRAERAKVVSWLADQGLNGLQIAKRLGISRAYAYELLRDPAGTTVRARRCRACSNAWARAQYRLNSRPARRYSPERAAAAAEARWPNRKAA